MSAENGSDEVELTQSRVQHALAMTVAVGFSAAFIFVAFPEIDLGISKFFFVKQENLSGNFLSTIPSGIKVLHNLTNFDISGNKIHRLEDVQRLRTLSSLKNLNLTSLFIIKTRLGWGGGRPKPVR